MDFSVGLQVLLSSVKKLLDGAVIIKKLYLKKTDQEKSYLFLTCLPT